MLHKYLLVILLGVSCTAQSLDTWDEETPWTPLKKEHALFYSGTWAVIAGFLAHGIYLLGKTLKKPDNSNAIMNDAICLLMMGVFAKLVHHSAKEVVCGLHVYSDNQATHEC